MAEPRIRRTLHSIAWAFASPRSRFRRGLQQGGLGSQAFPGQVFDHTSIIKTVMNLFGVDASLGAARASSQFHRIDLFAVRMRTDGDAIASMLGQPAPAVDCSRRRRSAGLRNARSRDKRVLEDRHESRSVHEGCHPAASRGRHASVVCNGRDARATACRMPSTPAAPSSRRMDYIQAVAARVERLAPERTRGPGKVMVDKGIQGEQMSISRRTVVKCIAGAMAVPATAAAGNLGADAARDARPVLSGARTRGAWLRFDACRRAPWPAEGSRSSNCRGTYCVPTALVCRKPKSKSGKRTPQVAI